MLQSKVPYAKTAELGRYISPIFEELNWAYSSAISIVLALRCFLCGDNVAARAAGRDWQQRHCKLMSPIASRHA